jgi:diacylglycerol kinase family enzyme
LLVFLNSRADHGRAGARWHAVQGEIANRALGFEIEETTSLEGIVGSMRRALERGERVFVAAGGDGTVNLLVNAMMELPEETGAALGAIGLGSSNDFHKPFDRRSLIGGVPVRLDRERAMPCDVIRVDFERDDGASGTRYAIINASLGITAEANASFNAPTRFIRAAKKLSVDAAIVASVLHTLATYRGVRCRIAIDGAEVGAFSVSNLGVIKNPHFAGSFCYDTPIEPDDGFIGVNLCERLTRFQALATLAALKRRRFRGRPKTRSWVARRASAAGDRVFALETDGEVVHARSVTFSVVPKGIRCCR